jgi:hypothetical protein
MMSPPDLRGAVGKFPDHILRMSEGYDYTAEVRGRIEELQERDVDGFKLFVGFIGFAVLALGLLVWGAF